MISQTDLINSATQAISRYNINIYLESENQPEGQKSEFSLHLNYQQAVLRKKLSVSRPDPTN